jgi:hypothetical protein
MVVLSMSLILALSVPAGAPKAAADFLTAYVAQDRSLDNFESARALSRFTSPRLQQVLKDAESCQADWTRQQPKDSTDKPPFVDCCLFASSPEGIPTAFRLGAARALPDQRYEVDVEFTYAEKPGTYEDSKIPLASWKWRDAVIVARLGNRYLVDDFVFQRDAPHAPAARLSDTFQECRAGRWVGGR